MNERSAQQAALAAGAARDLGGRLDAVDHDIRILSNLVTRTRRTAQPRIETQNQVILSAFDALVAVVENYRTIALYSPADLLTVGAVDPTEDRVEVAKFLFDEGSQLASLARHAPRTIIRGPLDLGGTRFFYLFAAQAGRDEVIVIASDAGLFLNAALPHQPSDSRFAAIDPNLYSWRDCQQSSHCRPAHDELGKLRADPQARWLDAAAARAADLPESPALVAAAITDSIGGRWTVAVTTSVARIAERETALLRQLIVTSLAAALAVVAVGLFILRQQRQAGALHERLHTAHQLATMREKTDAMVENAPLGILGIAEDGTVVIANRFLTDRLGPIQIGQRWEEAFAPDARPGAGRLRALLERARVDPSGKVEARGVDLLAPEAGDFDVRAVLLRHGSEDVRLLALIEDRSQVRSLEQQLVRTEKILTAGVLSAGLAHEIGTPISVIRACAENLLDSLGQHPGADDLAAIIRHSDRISSTIRQVLDFSRAQAIHLEPVPPAAALAKAHDLLDWKLSSKGVSLSSSIAPGVAPFAAAPDQLEQVLVNLILNACDACQPGGAIRVEVTAAPEADRLRLEIRDNGRGIPPEHVNAVFDPFFTTKKRGEGTGLGLTVVASIVRNHGGEVSLVSSQGAGTTVLVIWPSAAAAQGLA
ncbi:MAG TPA: ATP-binding protein [Polyangia bacterium]|nr:ATP-binding protein [Polyangia bacterium]